MILHNILFFEIKMWIWWIKMIFFSVVPNSVSLFFKLFIQNAISKIISRVAEKVTKLKGFTAKTY